MIQGGDDTINMSADWDAFGLDMASLYEPVSLRLGNKLIMPKMFLVLMFGVDQKRGD
jgi:hypothetical protein